MTKIFYQFGLYISLVSFLFTASCQSPGAYNDGPYIDIVGDSIQLRWVESGIGHDSMIHYLDAKKFEKPGLPSVDLSNLYVEKDDRWEFSGAQKIIALSDLHGQFDIFLSLLKAQKVIDENNKWIFGSNFLVITGDHFSRGDKVLDILWFLFELEKQSALECGNVQVLLGNHEVMALNNDIRYLNAKYGYTSKILKTEYYKLFSATSVLGKWLRNKKVVVYINDIMFLHGGISNEVANAKLSAKKINAYFRDSILIHQAKAMSDSKTISLLLGDNGPLWYRGYADSLSMTNEGMDKILDFYNVNNVVIGHTSMPEILTKYEGKVVFIDCNIKTGKSGEVMIWQKDKFYRGLLDGSIRPLTSFPEAERVSLFQYIASLNDSITRPKIVIKSDIKKLINNSLKEELQDAMFDLYGNDANWILSLNTKWRARGNMRKQVCEVPPVKFDFKKKELKVKGLTSGDKLKLVMPCTESPNDQEKLLLEYCVYELFALIEPNHLYAQLLDINLVHTDGKVKYDFTGILVEDEEAYTSRTNAKILGHQGNINSGGLERKSFLRMYFFQYMIGNTDWSIANRHNVMLAKLPSDEKLTALPYDYDYSGFVDQRYAVPSSNFPIGDVTERYFPPYSIKEEEADEMIRYFLEKEAEIILFCDKITYLEPKTIEKKKKYLSDFFKELKKPEQIKSKLKLSK